MLHLEGNDCNFVGNLFLKKCLKIYFKNHIMDTSFDHISGKLCIFWMISMEGNQWIPQTYNHHDIPWSNINCLYGDWPKTCCSMINHLLRTINPELNKPSDIKSMLRPNKNNIVFPVTWPIVQKTCWPYQILSTFWPKKL